MWILTAHKVKVGHETLSLYTETLISVPNLVSKAYFDELPTISPHCKVLTGPRDFSLKNTLFSSRQSLTSLKLSVGNWNLSIKRADKCLLACTFGSWLKHDTELAQVVDS
jgi:hypothetical protein